MKNFIFKTLITLAVFTLGFAAGILFIAATNP
jgi:hypothetical protein